VCLRIFCQKIFLFSARKINKKALKRKGLLFIETRIHFVNRSEREQSQGFFPFFFFLSFSKWGRGGSMRLQTQCLQCLEGIMINFVLRFPDVGFFPNF